MTNPPTTCRGDRAPWVRHFIAASIFALLSACHVPRGERGPSPHSSQSRRGEIIGTWRVEHVEVFAGEGLGTLGEDAASSLRETWTRTDRSNARLREEQLVILHVFNREGTCSHTLDWIDAPERRFSEVGTWSLEPPSVVKCVNATGGPSSLPSARVLFVDEVSLIVRMDFEGSSAGKSEIVRHRRVPSPVL